MKFLFIFWSLALISGRSYALPDPNFNDATILYIVQTADQGEATAAELALSRATNAEVRDFAQMMKNEHNNNLSDSQKVAKENNIKPKTNPEGKTLKKETDTQIASLKKEKKGSDFDRAYISNQIAAHKQLLDNLDNKLIDSAKDAAFVNFLKETRVRVQAHLSHAEEILKKL